LGGVKIMGQPTTIECRTLFNTEHEASLFQETLKKYVAVDNKQIDSCMEEGDYSLEDYYKSDDTEISFLIGSSREQNADWQEGNFLKLAAQYGCIEFNSSKTIHVGGCFYSEEDLKEIKEETTTCK